jgi:hypothetical protein
MRLQLQSFDCRLVYKPGKELFIADTLSRAPSPRLFTDDVTQDSEDQVHHVLHSLVTSVSTRKRYAEATALDPTLQLLKTVIQTGWPEKRAQCPAAVKPYCAERIVNGGRLFIVWQSFSGSNVPSSRDHGGYTRRSFR